MSHQTGIRANEDLRKFFGKCRDGSIRLIKIGILDEQLALEEYTEPKNTCWEKDYASLIKPLLEENQPCYILFRLDTKDNAGYYTWLLYTWSPEHSPVRQKMLYASTKATLKNEFGTGQISQEVFVTSMDEAGWEGYLKIKRNKDAPVPLTLAEEELAELKRNAETNYNDTIGVDTRHQTLQGVMFPLTEKAIGALGRFRKKQVTYVQLKIELEKEVIELASMAETQDVTSLHKRIPESTARYHLFWFPHSHEGDYIESSIFIYSMPGYNCSIKERMLYSTCKGPLISGMEAELKLIVDKRLEIDSGSELTQDFLMEELYPTKSLNRPKFAKPKGPANRGAKRITKIEGGGDGD